MSDIFIQESKQLLKRFQQAIAKHPRFLELRSHATNHINLLGIIKGLDSRNSAQRETAFIAAKEMFGTRLKEANFDTPGIAAAQKEMAAALKDSHELLGNKLESILQAKPPASPLAGVETTAPKLRDWGNSLLKKHREFVGKRSETARLMITNGEALLGSIMAIQGGCWMVHALRSEQLAPQQDENGNMRLSMVSVPASHRAKEAAMGLATLAAGIGVAALGFSAMNHDH